MKLTIHFKTPDTVNFAIRDVVQAEFDRDFGTEEDLPREVDHPFWEETDMQGKRKENELKDFVSRWVDHGEAISVEFDMKAGTATVLER